MKSIGIFCGSSEGHSSVYMQAAREAGTYLAQAGPGWALFMAVAGSD